MPDESGRGGGVAKSEKTSSLSNGGAHDEVRSEDDLSMHLYPPAHPEGGDVVFLSDRCLERGLG